MPTFVTRRTALGVAATAALASLTACASDIRPLEDPSVVDPMRPYKGELKFNSYKSTGEYEIEDDLGHVCGAGLLGRSPELPDGYWRRYPVQGRGPGRHLRAEDEGIRRVVRKE